MKSKPQSLKIREAINGIEEKTYAIKITVVWTISVCFMLFSQVLSIFGRVLCEVVTHRKPIIGSAKAAPAGRKVSRNAGEQPA